jgi:predicted DNA-binding transcriptional regulator AlpA
MLAADDDLLTMEEVRVLFGGSKRPLNQATIYRMVKGGRIPRPIKISPQISRWVRSECLLALKAFSTERT